MALIKKAESINGSLEIDNEVHTVLGLKASFEGKLLYQGCLRIDGEFKGDIETEDTLILGESAVVNATVKVGNLIVMGLFTGTANVKEKVDILGKAKFLGDLLTKRLHIEDGAVFEGQCCMQKNISAAEKRSGEMEMAIVAH